MEHKSRVREMMQGYGQSTPEELTMPSASTRKRICSLLLEEVFELIEACGLDVTDDLYRKLHYPNLKIYPVSGVKPNFIEMVDALCDISVVTHGGTNGLGISYMVWRNLLREVDQNNLLKIRNGHLDSVTGKFIKPKDHPKPNIEGVLLQQGMIPE
jgi:predicted HAD superfamily Cof-like phosphohydrolase